MDDIVFVTGASGFVGSAVARALAGRGAALRLLVRRESPRANLAGLDAEIVEGDMRDAEAMKRALAGARYLFHVAADYRIWARDRNEIARNNLEGTRATMQAALAAGVEKIVYTSSVAALKPLAGRAADESSRHSEASVIGTYKRSKLLAERLVERMVAEEKLPAVIVSPSTPIGPRDVKPTPTGRIIVEAARGRMPAFVDTGLNLVHVDDVAAGHLAALDRGGIGEVYILGGEDVTLQTMLGRIAAFAGRRPPRLKLPRGPLYPLAFAAEAIARVNGREPLLTADALRMSRYRMFFSSTKAERDLGYRARPYDEGLGDALGWFGAHGYLDMIAGILFGFMPLGIWLYLMFGRSGFWRFRERDDRDAPGDPVHWPSVVAVVPARNEADMLPHSLPGLLAQDYPGPFRVVLVDDQSSDGTGELACGLGDGRLAVVTANPRPSGWTGKSWALAQGVQAAGAADFLWFTDADIAHAPDNLRRLVARAQANGTVLVSLMARLHCRSAAEHFLIPAFVFFFAMLFPFAAVNDPKSRIAAAAGGCMLVERAALEAAGGVATIRADLIDDCALARALKAGGPIWLGLGERAVSLRAYELPDIRDMVARSAYAQLGFSPLLLAGTLLGLAFVFFAAPLVALFAWGISQMAGWFAWITMALAFQPILRVYRLSPLWGAALPLIAGFYAAFTIDSAIQYFMGRGGMWKGRAQAELHP